MRSLIEDVHARWAALDERIGKLDDEYSEMVRHDPPARRLTSSPGIGALNATALVAAVGNAGAFARGRDLAAWLGLVARQVTTGGTPVRHHQAWEQAPAQDADPGCLRGDPDAAEEPRPNRRMAPIAAGARSRQQGRGGAGREDGADGLGAAAPRDRLRGRSSSGLTGSAGENFRQPKMSVGGEKKMARQSIGVLTTFGAKRRSTPAPL